MKKDIIKIGLIQQSCSPSALDNRRRLAGKIRRLAGEGADIVALQELHDTLYFCQTESVENFNLAVDLNGEEVGEYSRLAKELGVVLVISVFERRAPGLYHNTAVVIDTDGSVAGKYRKMHIPDDPAYYEKFYFTPGDLGFEPVDTSIGRIGVLVCWDQWYPEAARIMALKGAEILIYPTAIGWDGNDTPQEKARQIGAWEISQRAHAVANGIPVVAVNRVGLEPDPSGATGGIQFWGHSFVVGPQGETLFVAPDDAECEAVVEVDTARTEQVRRWWPFLRDRRVDAYGDITSRYIDD